MLCEFIYLKSRVLTQIYDYLTDALLRQLNRRVKLVATITLPKTQCRQFSNGIYDKLSISLLFLSVVS